MTATTDEALSEATATAPAPLAATQRETAATAIATVTAIATAIATTTVIDLVTRALEIATPGLRARETHRSPARRKSLRPRLLLLAAKR